MDEAKRGFTILTALLLVTTGLASVAPAAQADHGVQAEHVAVTSPVDGAEIWITVCQPTDATSMDPVPVVLHGHGWSGSRTTDCDSFQAWHEDGFATVSIDQRGHGESGGQTHVMDPDYEGQDLEAIVDHIAGLDWIAKDGPQDPQLAAIGGSYGGGYQFALALTETMETGDTRIDALAPEITWYDLPQSLAPNKVIRSVWVDALYTLGAAQADMHQGIHESFWWGTVTGQIADEDAPVYDISTDFRENSPVGYVEDEGVNLDVPILMRQGITDNLFPLNQAWHNLVDTLTADARADSALIGYNGGHALPNAYPLGETQASIAQGGDPCSAQVTGGQGFAELTRGFFADVFAGDAQRPTPATYMLATPEGECLELDSLAPTDELPLEPIDATATTTGVGAAQYIPVEEGPVTVAGIPSFEATALAAGVDQRAFLGLAVGQTPADATVVNNNLYPVRTELPGEHAIDTELAGLAVDIDEDETLYLVVTPVSDMFVHHGSRTPGGLVFTDVSVHLPIAG